MNMNEMTFMKPLAAPELLSRDVVLGNATYHPIPSELIKSASYQRTLNQKKIRDIVDHYDPNKANTPKVSLRDGQYWVFDGAHTLAAMKEIHHGKPFDVMCRIYHGLTYEMQAALFASQYDNATRVPFMNRLRAQLAAEDEQYEAFKSVTQKTGLVLSGKGRVGYRTIGAIDKAWTIYSRNGFELYEKMLRVIMRTWNGESWSLHAPILGGVACFIKMFPDFNEDRFIKNLSSVNLNTLQRDANGISRSQDISFAAALARHYNLHGGRGKVNVGFLLA